MSWIDNHGITHHSFYETEEEMGIKSMTEEELIEYKRLVGMPISNDYDELIESLTDDSQSYKKEQSHDIESEKKLVSMLGYNLIGPDNSNRWLIIDEKNNQVGFIQYKKLFNANAKKGYSKTYGYHTEIDSKTLSYKSTRKIANGSEKTSFDTRFNYNFDIKRENGGIDHIDINVGDCPGLTLWSKEHGFMSFKVDYKGIYLNFKSKTENFNTEEVLVYKTDGVQVSDHPKEYSYQLRYCDKCIKLEDENLKGIKIREINGKSTPYQQNYNEMKVVENTWINGKLRTNKENIVTGTVEEMVIKHGMGIDAFNHFRFLINQILPFKQEVISAMLENYLSKREELSLIIPELGVENNKEKIRKK